MGKKRRSKKKKINVESFQDAERPKSSNSCCSDISKSCVKACMTENQNKCCSISLSKDEEETVPSHHLLNSPKTHTDCAIENSKSSINWAFLSQNETSKKCCSSKHSNDTKPTCNKAEESCNLPVVKNQNCFLESSKEISQNMHEQSSDELAVFNPRYGTRPKTRNSEYFEESSSLALISEKPLQYHDVFKNIQMYENFKRTFYNTFKKWETEREDSIKKLQELKSLVHHDQMFYNKAKCICKEVNIMSRVAKAKEISSTADFMASLCTFVTDAADGIASVAQAVNIDGYQKKFKEIMEHDSEITKTLHASRSMCLKQYENVEEIIRPYHSLTFNDMISQISEALGKEEYLQSKNSKERSVSILNASDNALSPCCNKDAMATIRESIEDYVTGNPATVEACKSVGRAICDVLAWGFGDVKSKNTMQGNVNLCGNLMFMMENNVERDHLMHIIEEDEPQAKLEKQIDDAIDALQYEIEDVSCLISYLRTSFEE